MRGRRAQTGHSLVEVLVATAIMGLVMSATLSVLQSGLAAWGWGAGRVEAQQAIRAALERMAHELREAGYDPTDAGIEAVLVAEPARIVFQRDLNGNGLIDPTRERVTYLLRSGETTLRRDAGGGAQPLAENVRRFSLSYLDKAGAPTADPARVASVRIEIEAGRAGPKATMATLVSLRNGAFW
ncbi:MAG TPA: prepilin-type N-terminal cleavage/methylation domain-containing protein [Methylomirabilota bacterium]|nr:prepilin-type N-terminal cleavage/methylation domain-containing protein [Methylomirabilota bacterium]